MVYGHPIKVSAFLENIDGLLTHNLPSPSLSFMRRFVGDNIVLIALLSSRGNLVRRWNNVYD